MVDMPRAKENPDFSIVIRSCQEHLMDMEAGVEDNDTKHYIYEDVMTAIFGNEVWLYINEKLQ